MSHRFAVSSRTFAAVDKALAEIKREQPNFSLEGGSWTNDIARTNAAAPRVGPT